MDKVLYDKSIGNGNFNGNPIDMYEALRDMIENGEDVTKVVTEVISHPFIFIHGY